MAIAKQNAKTVLKVGMEKQKHSGACTGWQLHYSINFTKKTKKMKHPGFDASEKTKKSIVEFILGCLH